MNAMLFVVPEHTTREILRFAIGADKGGDSEGDLVKVEKWILHAIDEKMGHLRRARKAKKRAWYICAHCEKKWRVGDIHHIVRTLFGETEGICLSCHARGLN